MNFFPLHLNRIVVLFSTIFLLSQVAISQSEIPAGTPVKVDPQDFTLIACVGSDRQARTFCIVNTSNSKIELRDIQISPDAEPEWANQQGLRGGTVEPGESIPYTITFDPTQVGETEATLDFCVTYPSGGGTVTQKIKIPIKGIGKDWTPAEDSGESSGDEGGGTDTGNGDGTGNDDGTGSGSESGEEDGEEKEECNICLTFYCVDDVEGQSDEDIQKWIKEANEIFECIGVTFSGKKSSESAEKDDVENNKKDDPHCIDIYIVEQVPGDENILGEASMMSANSRTWESCKDMVEGVDERFKEKWRPGESVQLEPGEKAAHTLAHELGHVLGLGVQPEDGVHLDPETGEPITDEERLMHPKSNNGKKLTAKEKEIAKKTAGFLKTTFTPCENASQTVPGNESQDFRSASVQNFQDRLVFKMDFVEPIELRKTTALYSIAFDYDLDGMTDFLFEFQHFDGEWFSEFEFPQAYVETTDSPEEAVWMHISKKLLTNDIGKIGWNSSLVIPELEMKSSLPADGFQIFDITMPGFTIDLVDDLKVIESEPGQEIVLGGALARNNNFSGEIEMEAALMPLDVDTHVREVEIGSLPFPQDAEWKQTVQLPEDVPAGTYNLIINAECEVCQARTSVNSEIIISEPTGISDFSLY